jgi:hypothetical protein
VTVADARAALIDKIEDIASLRENYMDSRPTPSVHDKIAEFEKSVREDEREKFSKVLAAARLVDYEAICIGHAVDSDLDEAFDKLAEELEAYKALVDP